MYSTYKRLSLSRFKKRNPQLNYYILNKYIYVLACCVVEPFKAKNVCCAALLSLVDDEGRFQHLFINFPMMNKKAVEFFPEPKMLVDAMLWYAAVSQRFTCWDKMIRGKQMLSNYFSTVLVLGKKIHFEVISFFTFYLINVQFFFHPRLKFYVVFG